MAKNQPMNLASIEDWHYRYAQQARWTQDLRRYLYQRVSLQPGQRVLDVGCGTGILLPELFDQGAQAYGLDIEAMGMRLAIQNQRGARYCQGDANQLPFPANTFNLVLCHFLLMWLAEPLQALQEMVRVTQEGGSVLVMAEPDYGGRIDYPENLESLGAYQIQSLIAQGADPYMGRKLSGYFHLAGLKQIESGVLGGQWSGVLDWEAWDDEWRVLASDSAHLPQTELDLSDLKALDRIAYQTGQRVLFVPTFYAWGIA